MDARNAIANANPFQARNNGAMGTWEERMSARRGGENALARRRQEVLRSQFEDAAWQREVKLDQGFEWIDSQWLKPEPDTDRNYCEDCCRWNPHRGAWVVNCFEEGKSGPEGCRHGHEHHRDELWIGLSTQGL